MFDRYTYSAELDRVVDGDTIDLFVDLGFGLTQKMRVRVARIDAWEKRGEEYEKGIDAATWVDEQLVYKDLRIKTMKDKKGKYGRYIAEIYYLREANVTITPDNVEELINLSDELVKLGHAEYVEY